MPDVDKPAYLTKIIPPYPSYPYFTGAQHDSRRFRPQAQGFDPVNAWWLCEASILSYSHENFVRQEFGKVQLPEVVFFNRGSTQCYVACNDDFLIVVFRGTEIWAREGETNLLRSILAILEDIVADGNIRLVPEGDSGQGEMVHLGFQKALDAVWENGLLSYLRSKDRNGRTFWFTGHSLGAALATLAWKRYRRLGNAPGLYTFGSPRVGDRGFGAGFEQTYRFVNNQDIVTMVPPRNAYHHVGCLKYLKAGSGLIETVTDQDAAEAKDLPAEWSSFLNSPKGIDEVIAVLRQALTAMPVWANLRDVNIQDVFTLVPRVIDKVSNFIQKAVSLRPPSSKLKKIVEAGLNIFLPQAVLDHVPILYAEHIKKNIPLPR